MKLAQHLLFTLVTTLCAAGWWAAQAQSPRVTTVNITAEADRVQAAAQGDVTEMRIEVLSEAGDIVFESGAFTDQQLVWNMRDAAGERVRPGTYLVTVTFRNAGGKLRKRVEQVLVTEEVTAGGSPLKAEAQAGPSPEPYIAGTGTTGRIAKWTNNTGTLGNSIITESTGKIGIGISAPVTPLHVVGSATNAPALFSANNGSGGIGLKGASSNAAGVGVWGSHLATTGVTPGVRGETNSLAANAVGVLGLVNSTNAGLNSAAVRGINKGQGNTAAGVWGETESSAGYGVYGSSKYGYGVYGTSPNSVGVYGFSNNGTGVIGSTSTGYAGLFDGRVRIQGNLSVGSCDGCSPSSDRNLKANFSSVNPRTILDQLSTIPIQMWNYKSEPATVRHLGAMAQDFRAAFGLGESDRTLNTVDAQGVTMAAIQGLYQLVKEKDAQLERQIRLNEEQSRQLGELQTRLRRIERNARSGKGARRIPGR